MRFFSSTESFVLKGDNDPEKGCEQVSQWNEKLRRACLTLGLSEVEVGAWRLGIRRVGSGNCFYMHMYAHTPFISAVDIYLSISHPLAFFF